MTKYELFRIIKKNIKQIDKTQLKKTMIELKNLTPFEKVSIDTLSDLDINFDQSDLDLFKKDLILCEKNNINISIYGDENFPIQFILMKDPPLIIYYVGEKVWEKYQLMTVVGSREPTSKSLSWLDLEFSKFIEHNKVATVSGGARGVDQKIHCISLRKKMPTIVVLPSGFNEIYPTSLNEITQEILKYGGCLLSEYPPLVKMNKYFFHERNRLVAALGVLTFIVEAQLRSGTLMTAHLAADEGKIVLTLPGFPSESAYEGNLQLIFDGAQMVRCVLDLEQFFWSEVRDIQKNYLSIDQSYIF